METMKELYKQNWRHLISGEKLTYGTNTEYPLDMSILLGYNEWLERKLKTVEELLK